MAVALTTYKVTIYPVMALGVGPQARGHASEDVAVSPVQGCFLVCHMIILTKGTELF